MPETIKSSTTEAESGLSDVSIPDDISRRQALIGAAALSALYSTSALADEEKNQEVIDTILSSDFNSDEYSASGDTSKRRYAHFFTNNTVAAGVLDVPAGEEDSQNPHILDEFYIVLKGRATLKAGDEEYVAEPGQVLFVKAGVEHNFLNVEEDLQAVVIFSTADPKGIPFYEKK